MIYLLSKEIPIRLLAEWSNTSQSFTTLWVAKTGIIVLVLVTHEQMTCCSTVTVLGVDVYITTTRATVILVAYWAIATAFPAEYCAAAAFPKYMCIFKTKCSMIIIALLTSLNKIIFAIKNVFENCIFNRIPWPADWPNAIKAKFALGVTQGSIQIFILSTFTGYTLIK